ncbi:MAG TPA: TonB-dependent receptor [Blastocatellia bacterium]|nr:TonB-dependent receptor [Blastocatellia bacterium]HMV87267.1 TonB-dependent receptor [Blastocatellia bacterium]HMY73705.1 TonB-dependent receptor [Blastocatellia bacterium]HMZ21733.1 TonB-dependent receptor [Blastocatellia bacterium]HNG29247.1 TonB-dependent receptor [Blastocatellia bacterium]
MTSKSFTRPGFFPVMTALLLALSAFVTAFGQQSATATMEGIITDPNNAVVVGAKVVARSVDTGLTREAITDDSGLYRLTALPPGTYALSASASGFAENKYGNVTLLVGQKLNLDLSLRVNVSETVQITAAAPIVETTRTNVSSSVNARAVSELPVNGRNFLDFVTLTPGVVRDPRAGDLSFGGQRGTLNSVQIDGVDNNNLFFGQSLGRTGSGRAPYQFSQDAVQEFQVNTNTFSAELGRAAGGIVNVVTKSGTNDFHGTGFWFYRDRALNANNLRFDAGLNNFAAANGGNAQEAAFLPAGRFFNATTRQVTGTPTKPPYHFNQFGGNLGGPIKKDRAHFFFNYDGQRSTTNNIVAFGNTPAATDTVGTTAFNRLLQQFGASYPRSFNQDVYLGKVDWQVDNANRLSVRYNRQEFTGVNLENGGATSAQERSGNSLVNTDTVTVTLTTAFSPRVLNEFRTQMARDKQPGLANSDNPEAEVREGGVSVVFFGRNNFSPRETSLRKFQFVDNVTLPAGKHNFKTGVDVNMEKIKNFFPGLFGGQYVFNTLADFQNNLPARFSQAFGGEGTTGATSRPNFNEFSFFAQDDWRATQQLTLNFGVRYDAQVMKRPPTKNESPALAAAGIDTSRLDNDYNNIAPRFGFAFKPFKSRDNVVVRGGYGLFYGRTPAIAFGTAHTQNGLNVASLTFNLSPTVRLPFNYPGRFAGIRDIPCSLFTGAAVGICQAQGPASTITPNIFVMARNFQQPYTQQGSFGIEYGVTNNLALRASYLLVKGNDLSRTRDINLLPAVTRGTAAAAGSGAPTFTFQRYPGVQGAPTRPIAGFGRVALFENTANSQYHGFTFEAVRRMAQHFEFSAAYTWSKVIDDAPDATSVVALNAGDDAKMAQYPFNLRDERGLGNADVPHRFVFNGTWDLSYFGSLPGAAKTLINGWQFSSILQAQSNFPFSRRIGVDLNNDGNANSDRVPQFGRNTERLEEIINVDFRLTKVFQLREKVQLKFFAEFFNAFNRANRTSFDGQQFGVAGLGENASPVFTPRAQFLTPRTTSDPRIGQLALKLSF